MKSRENEGRKERSERVGEGRKERGKEGEMEGERKNRRKRKEGENKETKRKNISKSKALRYLSLCAKQKEKKINILCIFNFRFPTLFQLTNLSTKFQAH